MTAVHHEVIDLSNLGQQPTAVETLTSTASLSGTGNKDDRYLAYHHLSSAEAQRRLLAAAEDVLSEKIDDRSKESPESSAALHRGCAISVLCALSLIAFFIYVQLEGSPYQWRATGALIEACLLLIAAGWNVWIQHREKRLAEVEVKMRIQAILESVKTYGLSRKSDLRHATSIPTVSIARVIRDETIQLVPFNLVVEDDIVQMAFGDTAPCRLVFVYSHLDKTPRSAQTSFVLHKGQMLRPSLFGLPGDTSMTPTLSQTEGQYYFRATETPVKDTLKAALHFKRPQTLFAQQLGVIQRYQLLHAVCVVFGAALLVNVLRYAIKASSDPSLRNQGVELLLVLQVYAVLPLLPFAAYSMYVIARSYGNAQILSLFDALQTSGTEFEDTEDVDEFDAAPPPTKELGLDWALVWKRFRQQFLNLDVTFLARTTGLISSLASTTVICAVDREGTISLPVPSVEQLFFFDEFGEPVVLDLTEDNLDHIMKFEDRHWQSYLGSLKPLGLNLLLNTDCGAAVGKTRFDHHRKSNAMHVHGHLMAARQACLCQIGRSIGFSADAVRNFVSIKALHCFMPYGNLVADVPDYHAETPSMLSQIFREMTSETHQMFSEGSLEVILRLCCDYWNGRGLGIIDQNTEKKMLDFYQNSIISDTEIVAYSYRPLPNAQSSPLLQKGRSKQEAIYIELDVHDSLLRADSIEDITPALANDTSRSWRAAKASKRRNVTTSANELQVSEKLAYAQMLKNQTFLSMASLAFQPKPNIINFIEDVGLAGIRFVYFSSAPERESKAYGERLGLDVDWNSCILLSSGDGETPGYRELHDIKARLPRGVENIREHIEHVDDVPLHVPLFAECEPSSVREMIRIFQEHGEVVCCVGSSLNEMNVECFAMADISIAIDPLAVLKSRHAPSASPLSPLNLGAALISSPCAFSLHSDTSVYSLSQIIRDARVIIQNAAQVVAFYLACQVCMSVTMIASFCLLLPPVFTGYQMMWMLWILLPPLALSFLFSPHGSQIMTVMPAKNQDHLKDRRRFFTYFVIRFSFPVLVSVAFFAVSLSYFVGESAISRFSAHSWLNLTVNDQWALLYAQNCTMIVFIVHIVTISASFLHRTSDFKRYPPYRNKVWMAMAVACLALQFVFTGVSLGPHGPYNLSMLPWWLYLVSLVPGPALTLAIQEIVKVHDRREWDRSQKRSKLEFNTKL
ncbi:hypothetical protein HDU85_003069 [Gaertneriomyces sp. JEL0708]|nr:hypothetical protein HDU85_003069 [Gaertneriomyces sp. JEL0708]